MNNIQNCKYSDISIKIFFFQFLVKKSEDLATGPFSTWWWFPVADLKPHSLDGTFLSLCTGPVSLGLSVWPQLELVLSTDLEHWEDDRSIALKFYCACYMLRTKGQWIRPTWKAGQFSTNPCLVLPSSSALGYLSVCLLWNSFLFKIWS